MDNAGQRAPRSSLDPPVALRPIEAAELDAFVELVVSSYARERASAVDAWTEDTRRNARSQVQALLPQGLATPDQHLYSVLEGNAVVGHLWIGMNDVDGFRSAFIYDIHLCEDARGRGLGRQVMALAEETARGLGARDIELHVFAQNTRARRLYEGLGYRITSVSMRKRLG
ncbi:GNAT family N-acetyltransferase [Sorangium sp. So ce1000]|uniref:GNAT family N-acetyltransferase n=1 Tax=Sorangium sp. So ce1000 TaxID=3133325 RepID=UPI003F6257FE